ncbi:hypothetical protein CRG98_031029 [Punica granatum]|uniref:Uncharacterized protein n=1 Tax=Punica granatum TaxID=22663 RepID=A0A2I0IY45_PUNGR|nr:hypothetical protein CRG98_031029 [Punica granatum]
MWTRSPESSKYRRGVRKAINADANPNVLICRKPASPLGRLLVALPDVGSVAGAIVVCWGCPGLAMKDSSSKRSAHVKGCVRDACSSVLGRPGDPYRVFALAMRMRSHFRRPQCEASKAHVGHARAYQDILNDALTTLSII